MTKELLQDIVDSQMVLIGIGKEMEESYQGMKEDTFYGPLLAQAEAEEVIPSQLAVIKSA